jgi:hypothetical protein
MYYEAVIYLSLVKLSSRKDHAMQRHRLLVLVGSFFAVVCGLSSLPALAVTPFTITATNVTMPTNGSLGISQYTVSDIPGAGTVTISCAYSGPATTAKIPQFCGIVGAPGIPVPAGETTFSGNILFVPYGQTPPPGMGKLHDVPLPSGHLPATGLALDGALMLGFGFRRRASRWLALFLLAAGSLASAAGISGCSAGNPMTSGTYQYTITAVFNPSMTNVLEPTNTTISVTVP